MIFIYILYFIYLDSPRHIVVRLLRISGRVALSTNFVIRVLSMQTKIAAATPAFTKRANVSRRLREERIHRIEEKIIRC